MSSKRKAPSPVKQDTKRVWSTGSQTRSVNQQKHQDGRGSTRAASTMNQATTDHITQQVVQGPSASSSAQHEVIYNRTSSIYKELDDYQRDIERRIILIGKTGAGKSALGNAMLGYKCFETDGFQMQSITTHCQIGQKKRNNGKNIVVIDTPGLKDTQQEDWKVIEQLSKCTAMTAPGPHAFCLVIRGDNRFTKESIDALDEFCKFFGEEIYKYVIVVFTHKASMGKSTTTDDCFSALPNDFVTKFLKFGGKKIAIESKAKKKALEKQIKELFKLIEEIIEKNDGGYYSGKKCKVAEEAYRTRIHTIEQEVEKQYKRKKKSLEAEYQEKAKQEKKWVKKLQAVTDKYIQQKKLTNKAKLENHIHVARMNAKIKTLKKKCKEKEKARKESERKLEEIFNQLRQTCFDNVTNDRNSTRREVEESQSFAETARNAVMESTGSAYDTVTSWLGNAITGAMQRWFRR